MMLPRRAIAWLLCLLTLALGNDARALRSIGASASIQRPTTPPTADISPVRAQRAPQSPLAFTAIDAQRPRARASTDLGEIERPQLTTRLIAFCIAAPRERGRASGGGPAEVDTTGTVTSRFIYGSRAHVPDTMLQGANTYAFITDPRGSVRLVVNTSTGEVAQRIDYGAFGELVADTNPGFQPFGFAGGLYDPDTGLVRFGARDYDAALGRWLSKDPIAFNGGANLYRYADNEPVNKIDITGNNPILAGVFVFVGVMIATDNYAVVGNAIQGASLATLPGAAWGLCRAIAARTAARAGVTAAQTIGRGLVSPGGKLGQLLPALESQFGAAAPKNALQALNVVGQATKSVGLESGYMVSQEGGKIVLQNVGGVVTTLGSEGSILVQRGSDVLLHLIP